MADMIPPGIPKPTRLRFTSWKNIDSTFARDYHIHSNYTDGLSTVQQIAQAAAIAGIVEILFSEHVRHTSTYFNHFYDEIRGLQTPGLKIYVGVETKVVDLTGRLDCSMKVASICDAIIGSVHRPTSDSNGSDRSWDQFDPETALEEEFKLAMAIVTSSQAHILGHPMGMVITRFNLRPLKQLYLLACACRDYGKAFELNSRYCPSPQDWIDLVERAGCNVSLGSDAHTTAEIGSVWHLFMKERENI